MMSLPGRTGILLLLCVTFVGSCSLAEGNSQLLSLSNGVSDSSISDADRGISVANLCNSIDALFDYAKYGEYGVSVDTCTSGVADDGGDVFFLRFNDPDEWDSLVDAMGDIPDTDVARYALWRLPLGLLSMGFFQARQSPSVFDQMLVSFANEKQTVYDVLPRDVSYVIEIGESKSKEEFSEIFNKRIDEISERVDVYNLNE